MKVLMQGRKNFYNLMGGDTVQLLNTKEQLEKMGIDVDISLDFEPDLSKYDIVHLSNVTRIHETYLHVKNAKKQNKPIVLSTIFWPMTEFEQNGQVGIRKIINNNLSIDNIERVKAIARYVKDKSARDSSLKNLISIGYTRMQNYVINNTDVFLPNAELEMNELKKKFKIKTDKYVVVPNAIDLNAVINAENENDIREFEKYRDAVICVGRIETRKNQLSLVKALDGTGIKLVLVGAVSNNHKKYFNEIIRIVEKNDSFYYIPYISNKELYKLYKICKVSALPSWLDTPGLVSLEAAAMGCNLAVSVKGTTKEYFGEYAHYCEPDNIESIRYAVMGALESDRNSLFKEYIRENYTWKKAAERTIEGYKLSLCK